MSATTRVLTGFPGSLLAIHVLWRLLEDKEAVTCVVPARFMERARGLLATRSPDERARVELLEGDVAAMDLGLSGREFMELAARVRLIHHCAAVTYSGAPLEMAERVNVNGTQEVLELALAAPRCERLVHWSSTLAHCPDGPVAYEDELRAPPRGRIARTRYRAEKLLARSRAKVPITVLRPAMLVGDSRSGEAARVEGALLLISVLLSAPRDVALPLPARANAPLNVVPLDYAVNAGLVIAGAADSVSRTYHIVDANPSTLEDALGLFASLTGRPAPKRFYPNPFSWALLRMPGIERTIHAQRALLDDLARGAIYDDRNARPILERAGLRCPALQGYAHKLVTYVERERDAKDARSSYRSPSSVL
jgi:thioester reductase-like protein